MAGMFELPSTEDELGETGRDLFGGAKPRWNDFDEDDEMPLGRNTLKMRSREIVKDKAASPVRPPITGAENNFRFPPPPPPQSFGAENGGIPRFQPQQPGYGHGGYQPAMKPPHAASSFRPQPPSSQPPSSQGGNNWQLSDEMMNQPWGARSPRAKHTLNSVIRPGCAHVQPARRRLCLLRWPCLMCISSPITVLAQAPCCALSTAGDVSELLDVSEQRREGAFSPSAVRAAS